MEFRAEVGAIVNTLRGHQCLRHHHPDTAGKGHVVRIVGMPAPAARALEIQAPRTILADFHFHRRVHDRIELGEGRRGLHIRVVVRHVDKRHLAVLARQRHRLDARLQATAPFLDHLVGELFVGLQPFVLDHFLDQVADHVAAGDAGSLVENPVLRRAYRTLAFMQPVAQRVSFTPVLRQAIM